MAVSQTGPAGVLVPDRDLACDEDVLPGEVVLSTVQYSTVQYSTVQYSAVQYSTAALLRSVQYSTVQYSTVQCSTAALLRRERGHRDVRVSAPGHRPGQRRGQPSW